MENKKNGLLIVIIILLVVALLGTVLYDKGLIFSNETEIEDQEQQEEKYDYTEISNTLNGKIATFIAYRGNEDGIDILSTPDKRLALIDYLIMGTKECLIYDNGVMQAYAYTSKEVYKNKYYEVYGDNYSLDNDLKNVNSGVANANDNNLGENYISWNNTWGTIGNTYMLIAQNIIVENEVYSLTGTYIKTNIDNVLESDGTFEIKYTKKDNVKNIESIILRKNKNA